ncbi:transposase [Actinomadura sp. NBRC 104412]|uniref:transposase n=1 Tax=Actinomadura sp. NBRC 104412 TaxID=3032203 RepID=UPI002553D97D|nr:transposase [Actinomadura sp. NBRC 104412]
MGRRWVGPRGWDVELIRLDGRSILRARQHGVLRGYYATIAELEVVLAAAGLTMADLVEVLPTAARRSSH